MKGKRKSHRKVSHRNTREDSEREKEKEKNRERSRDKDSEREKDKDTEKSKNSEDREKRTSSSKMEGKTLNNILINTNDRQEHSDLKIISLEDLSQYSTINLNKPALLELLKCPLCKGYYRTPYTINECMHTFCRSCIFKYFGCSNQREQCPVCKTKIGGRPIDSLIFDNYLDSLLNILFPKFEEIDKNNRNLLYKTYREAGNPLPGDEEEAKQIAPNLKIYIMPEDNQNEYSGGFLVPKTFNVISLKKLICKKLGKEEDNENDLIIVKFKDNELLNDYTMEVIDNQYGFDQDKNIFYYSCKKEP